MGDSPGMMGFINNYQLLIYKDLKEKSLCQIKQLYLSKSLNTKRK